MNFMIASPCNWFASILTPIVEFGGPLPVLRNGCEFPLYYCVERAPAKSTRPKKFLGRHAIGSLSIPPPTF
jgi:hypothetical protein